MTSDAPSPATGRFRFGEFEFDVRTGRLLRDGLSNDDAVTLSPQPAQLLRLLLESNGDLVTRDEIRDALWPDVHVDFDRSLNFCIHQVRTALGDSAGEPDYVETLPRRGYRLLKRAVPAEERNGARRKRYLWLAAGLVLVVTAALSWLIGYGPREGAFDPPSIAIMPFEPPEGREVTGDPGRIAERLLLEFGGLGPDRLGVVGPVTTRRYARDMTADRLRRETGVDWMINGRFVDSDTSPTGTGLLIEVIRVSDGMHAWVELVDDASPTAAIADRVFAAAQQEMELEAPAD